MFYLKLAYHNIRKNLSIFGPFLLAVLVLFILTCSTVLVLQSPVTDKMKHGKIALGLAVVVLTLFSAIMARYSFNFLIKQRSREFGLYTILGMNKLQTIWIATLELSMIYLVLILVGSILSSVFANFFNLIFSKLTQFDQLQFHLNGSAYLLTAVLFAGIFLLLEWTALRQIGSTSPLELFRSSESGEREPKGNILLAFLSLLSLGGGYFLSLTSTKIAALAVLVRFFYAVLLVILGTYLFYISFMTWYLKKRRANKAYFYQPSHFITTAQMIFRMKQNAVGMANITLLAIMTFVTIATTTSLYTGTETVSQLIFPKNTSFTLQETQEEIHSREEAKNQMQEALYDKVDVQEKDAIQFMSSLLALPMETGGNWVINSENVLNPSFSNIGFVYLVTQDDFRKLGNDLPQLSEQQIAIYQQKGLSQVKTLDYFGSRYDVVKNIQTVTFPPAINTYNSALIIVSSDEQFYRFLETYKEKGNKKGLRAGIKYFTYLDMTNEQHAALNQGGIALTNAKGNAIGIMETREDYRREGYEINGGFLFTGFLLGFSFLLGASLIIYYKQYSEGYEDKKSYTILQEVGMDQAMVKKTINSQIVLVFFLPILLAALHFIVALPMLRQMLLFFGITSSTLVYVTSAITILLISSLYYLIYKWTSKTYYRIVER